MDWVSHGKIFDPSDHSLINGCTSYAQSPQAVVFEDFVRVYFSTRARDINQKFLSHVGFVDFEKDLRTVRGVNSEEVISLGCLGAFDEHGIFPISPVVVGDDIFGYTTGWTRRLSVSVDTGIGLAISEDSGRTFKRYGDGPILSASLNEPYLVCDAFVRIFEGIFHMWYIYGVSWQERRDDLKPERTYKIAHASSTDGINWKKDQIGQIIPDLLGEQECQALPTVIKVSNKYHMFFGYRETFGFRSESGKGYRIGYAQSEDLVKWTRRDDIWTFRGSSDFWDAEMQCYPHAFECDGRHYLLYNGNKFGENGFGLLELELDAPGS